MSSDDLKRQIERLSRRIAQAARTGAQGLVGRLRPLRQALSAHLAETYRVRTLVHPNDDVEFCGHDTWIARRESWGLPERPKP